MTLLKTIKWSIFLQQIQMLKKSHIKVVSGSLKLWILTQATSLFGPKILKSRSIVTWHNQTVKMNKVLRVLKRNFQKRSLKSTTSTLRTRDSSYVVWIFLLRRSSIITISNQTSNLFLRKNQQVGSQLSKHYNPIKIQTSLNVI